ncbi:MFS transporter [Stigmatella sp. ncwal1]|uniref:MFS transporter n=1 Tax=Stigmatella ashevillensis TaxID=2995309 RepID=A0ABT5DBR9_9BACT|nr:MFS transporter [Stigmatella ashevillena]MDC0711117.1 MFS transporter [Stigmatella ashevillena]
MNVSHPGPSTPPGGRSRPLHVSLLCLTIAQIGITFYLPAFPLYAADIGEPLEKILGTVAIYLLFYGVAQLLAGPLSDRVGRRPLLLTGLGIFTLCALLIPLAKSASALHVLRAIQGAGGGVLSVMVKLILRDSYAEGELTRAFSILEAASSATPAIAPFLGGLICSRWGWQASFLAVGAWAALAGSTVLGLYDTRWQERSVPTETVSFRSFLKSYLHLFNRMEFVFAGMIVLMTYVANLVFLSFSPMLFQRDLHLSASNYGQLMMLPAAATALGGFVGSRLSTRLASMRVLQAGASGLLLSGGFLCSFWFWPTLSVMRALLPFMGMAFSASLIFPCAYSIAFSAHPAKGGFVAAMLGCLQLSGASFFRLWLAPGLSNLVEIGVLYSAISLVLLFMAVGLSLFRGKDEPTVFPESIKIK